MNLTHSLEWQLFEDLPPNLCSWELEIYCTTKLCRNSSVRNWTRFYDPIDGTLTCQAFHRYLPESMNVPFRFQFTRNVNQKPLSAIVIKPYRVKLRNRRESWSKYTCQHISKMMELIWSENFSYSGLSFQMLFWFITEISKTRRGKGSLIVRNDFSVHPTI